MEESKEHNGELGIGNGGEPKCLGGKDGDASRRRYEDFVQGEQEDETWTGFDPDSVEFDSQNWATRETGNIVRDQKRGYSEEERSQGAALTPLRLKDVRRSVRNHSSEVGPSHQAEIPALESRVTEPLTSRLDFGGEAMECLWDPVRATKAESAGQNIREFLGVAEAGRHELCARTVRMEALHQANYDVEKAKKIYIAKYGSECCERTTNLNSAEQAKFEAICKGQLLQRKDMAAAAKLIGVRLDVFLVNYYRWKTKSDLYQIQKQERRRESDVCKVCGDGGHLIVCESSSCRAAFHIGCLDPPLESPPDSTWYCAKCVAMSPARLRSTASFPQSSPRAKRKLPVDPTDSLLKVGKSAKASAFQRIRGVHKELPQGNNGNFNAGPRVPEGLIKNGGLCAKGDPVEDDRLPSILDAIDYTDSESGSPRRGAPEKGRPKTPQSDESTHTRAEADSPFTAADAAGASTDEESALDENTPEKLSRKRRPTALSNVTRQYRRSEYFVTIPLQKEGLMILVRHNETTQNLIFAGYRKNSDGSKSFAEQNNIFKATGDIFLDVDGCRCTNRSFLEQKNMLSRQGVGGSSKVLKMSHLEEVMVPVAPHPEIMRRKVYVTSKGLSSAGQTGDKAKMTSSTAEKNEKRLSTGVTSGATPPAASSKDTAPGLAKAPLSKIANAPLDKIQNRAPAPKGSESSAPDRHNGMPKNSTPTHKLNCSSSDDEVEFLGTTKNDNEQSKGNESLPTTNDRQRASNDGAGGGHDDSRRVALPAPHANVLSRHESAAAGIPQIQHSPLQQRLPVAVQVALRAPRHVVPHMQPAAQQSYIGLSSLALGGDAKRKLFQFLKSFGIGSAQAFLCSDTKLLAQNWAAQEGCSVDEAQDYICAARAELRNHFAQQQRPQDR